MAYFEVKSKLVNGSLKLDKYDYNESRLQSEQLNLILEKYKNRTDLKTFEVVMTDGKTKFSVLYNHEFEPLYYSFDEEDIEGLLYKTYDDFIGADELQVKEYDDSYIELVIMNYDEENSISLSKSQALELAQTIIHYYNKK